MPTVGGTAAAHAGAPGSDEIAATKEILGLDPAKNFALPDGLLVHAQQVADRGTDLQRSWDAEVDRKSTRLNSSHVAISYAVFCLKKKNRTHSVRRHSAHRLNVRGIVIRTRRNHV